MKKFLYYFFFTLILLIPTLLSYFFFVLAYQWDPAHFLLRRPSMATLLVGGFVNLIAVIIGIYYLLLKRHGRKLQKILFYILILIIFISAFLVVSMIFTPNSFCPYSGIYQFEDKLAGMKLLSKDFFSFLGTTWQLEFCWPVIPTPYL